MSQKISTKKRPRRSAAKIKIQHIAKRFHIKVRYLILAFVVGLLSFSGFSQLSFTQAASCPDLKIIFARGSGGEHNTDKNYLAFRDAIRDKLATTKLNYQFEDLDYPAVDVGITDLGTTLGALFSGGESYRFGDSVSKGSEKLIGEVNSHLCPNTKYVLGGYSQGAMVLSKSLPQLNPDKIIYAATFGDPKIYLPEGKGLFPDACRHRNLSDYRLYVPDCQTYSGMLSGYVPYRPDVLAGRVGTWCNKHDFFCSPFLSMDSHTSYVSDNLYEDASRVIFDKINQYFALGSHLATSHDTVILIDSTASMHSMFNSYKAEALRLARETIESGGRIALYDYRDLDDRYEPVQHCSFLTCDLALFEQELNNIPLGGGGDTPESLLSASLKAMREMSWQFGATKSIIVLTDAPFLSPDRDGSTVEQVIALSQSIDPVNFYIITTESAAPSYQELVLRTDGKVVTKFEEFSLLSDFIMDRYDSLPRVEDAQPLELPTLSVDAIERPNDTTARIKFSTNGSRVMVFLNDTPLGITSDTAITITDLDPNFHNIVTLAPLTDELRGESVSVAIDQGINTITSPKAPNTSQP